MQETARLAGEHDVDRVVELASWLRSDVAGERGGELWTVADAAAVDHDHVRGWLADPSVHLVVGGIDDVVLGFAAARVLDLRDGTRLGVIEELFVEPDARAVGIGELILDEIVGWCRACRCRGIDASALPGMRDSKNFFEGSGFVARRLVMHRRLDRE